MTERTFSILIVSLVESGDLTARASIRNAAVQLFADRGPEAVTVREIASAAGVSAALVLHHYGSKAGLRAAVDDYAAHAFDAVLDHLEHVGAQRLLSDLARGAMGSVVEAFVRGFPPGSPLPAYLRRLLLTDDPVGAHLFGRWYAAIRALLGTFTEAGLAQPSDDPEVRAAFLLVNDLALLLLRNQIAQAVGVDPLSPEGLSRWSVEVTSVYVRGAFTPPPTVPTVNPDHDPEEKP